MDRLCRKFLTTARGGCLPLVPTRPRRERCRLTRARCASLVHFCDLTVAYVLSDWPCARGSARDSGAPAAVPACFQSIKHVLWLGTLQRFLSFGRCLGCSISLASYPTNRFCGRVEVTFPSFSPSLGLALWGGSVGSPRRRSPPPPLVILVRVNMPPIPWCRAR